MREVTKSELLADLEGQVKYVAEKMGVQRDIRKAIVAPDTALWFNLTVPYKGELVTKPAIRIQHALPAGGGCRISEIKKIPEAMAEVGFLSFLMSLKLGIAGEKFGGGKAIIMTEKHIPRDLLDLLFIEFGKKMAPFMLNRDRIGPDEKTDHRDMEKFIEGLTNVLGGKVDESQIRALASGKEPDGTWKGGLLGRRESTGWGAAYAAKLAAEMIGLSIKGATVAVHGFGKVGIPAAERMQSWRAKIIAIDDKKGGILNRSSGLNLEDVKNFKRRYGTVVGSPGTSFISSEELLEIDCDILFSCATEGQIIEENADRVRARILSDASNLGSTGRAMRIMSDNGIIVLDGPFAGQAGVVLSNLEAVQNRTRKMYTFEEAVAHFEKKINNSFQEILLRKEMYDIDTLPDATLALGIERVIELRLGRAALEEILKTR